MNRKPIVTILSMIMILAFVLTGCSSPTPAAPTAAPGPTHRSPGCARTDRGPGCTGTHRSPGCARTDRGARAYRGS